MMGKIVISTFVVLMVLQLVVTTPLQFERFLVQLGLNDPRYFCGDYLKNVLITLCEEEVFAIKSEVSDEKLEEKSAKSRFRTAVIECCFQKCTVQKLKKLFCIERSDIIKKTSRENELMDMMILTKIFLLSI